MSEAVFGKICLVQNTHSRHVPPFARFWELPYYWAGCKMYDLLAGKQGLTGSYLLSRASTLAEFPLLRDAGLTGSLVYYDGM